jgi:cytochrome c biogenesis protein CcmG/thiol:disulfide interchange protein DsbE
MAINLLWEMVTIRRIISISILIVLAGAFIYTAFTLGKASTAAEVGDPAPDFELEDMEGNRVSLSDYRGQFVIVNFFASWCPPCREEAPEIQAFEDQYGEQVKILIIDRAEPKIKVQEFIEEFKSTSTYLLDYNDSMSKPYGIVGQPETFFIDEQGIIRYHHVGPMTTEFMVDTTNQFKTITLN